MTGTKTRRRTKKLPSSTSPVAKAVLPSTSTRTATRPKCFSMPSRIAWRIGTCCKNSRGFVKFRQGDKEKGRRGDNSGSPLLLMSTVLATHDFATGGLEAAQEFLKRTRAELRQLRKVRVWKDKLHVIDVNKDGFEVRGIGYCDAEIVPLLRMINTAFNPKTLHDPTDLEFKEFDTGRRHCW